MKWADVNAIKLGDLLLANQGQVVQHAASVEFFFERVCTDASHHPGRPVVHVADCAHPECQVRHVMES